ncbi:MAG TPA: polymer-forming cytoskeletal protein [Cyclobacteriaceae bacterium]|nr:polymer-forming cytoskeletal protein [Cyclobacteriaceae bacterium]
MRILIGAMAVMVWGLMIMEDSTPLNTRYGEEIRITSPVEGDIYLAAKKIIVDAPIRGDLVAAGGTVIINDSVGADILVAGGDVEINGYVGDDVRAAGGTVSVGGMVTGDVLAGNGELTLKKDAVVRGNLVTSGGLLDLFGYVKGDLNAAGNKLDFRGIVDGTLEMRGREIDLAGSANGHSVLSANTIDIQSSASFGKDVRYWDDDGTIAISPEVHKVKAIYDQSIKVEQPRWELLGFSSILMVVWYLGTALVMIWVIAWLFSRTMLNAAGVVLERTMGSIGYGILFLVGVPALCLLLAATVLAIPLAVILMIGYIVLIVLATPITAIIISNWINKVYYHSSWKLSHITLVAFGVFIVLKLFTLTPIIGPTIMAIMACMAIGAIVIGVWNNRAEVVETAS